MQYLESHAPDGSDLLWPLERNTPKEPTVPVLVTVHQYQGPTMQFAGIREYTEWLWNGGKEDPDHAVDLHEDWGQALPKEIANYHKEIDRLFDLFEAQRNAAYLDSEVRNGS